MTEEINCVLLEGSLGVCGHIRTNIVLIFLKQAGFVQFLCDRGKNTGETLKRDQTCRLVPNHRPRQMLAKQ